MKAKLHPADHGIEPVIRIGFSADDVPEVLTEMRMRCGWTVGKVGEHHVVVYSPNCSLRPGYLTDERRSLAMAAARKALA